MKNENKNKIIHYIYLYLKITLIITLALLGFWFFFSIIGSELCMYVNLEDTQCIRIITFDFEEEPNDINILLEIKEGRRWSFCSGITQLIAKDTLEYDEYLIKLGDNSVFLNNQELKENEKFEDSEFGLFFFIDPWVIETHNIYFENVGQKNCLEWKIGFVEDETDPYGPYGKARYGEYETKTDISFYHLIGENIYGWWFNFYLIPIFIIIWWYDKKLNKRPAKRLESENKEELK